MITRNDIISRAIEECLQELYKYAQPHTEWNVFLSENKKYSSDYIMWKEYNRIFKDKEKYPEKWKTMKELFPNWENKPVIECIGPSPYEFYYLPIKVVNDICDSYIHAYKLDNKQELLNTIEILKQYCNDPITDKYIDSWTDEDGYHPGYKNYIRPACLKARIVEFLEEHYDLYDPEYNSKDSQEILDMFFEFLDMAGNFYDWNGELNSFNNALYLGPIPNSNKQSVIDNWKQFRNQIIEINDNEYDNEEQDYD